MKGLIFLGLLISMYTFADTNEYLHNRCGEGYMVCHIPPGNPLNEHLISVGSINAVEAHVDNHGDTLGKCENTTYEQLRDLCGICDSDIDTCP